MPLKNWCSIHARCFKSSLNKAFHTFLWHFSRVLKQNFITYRSSKASSRPDYIFEIYQLWQSDFSMVYSNSCCNCSFEPEIIKISQSSHMMYSNNIVNFQESTPILNAHTKKSGNLLNLPCIYIYSNLWFGPLKFKQFRNYKNHLTPTFRISTCDNFKDFETYLS